MQIINNIKTFAHMNFFQKINLNSLNLFFFLSFLFLIFLIPARPYVWESYSDSYDYLTQSNISLTSAEFYAPHKKDGFYPRSFTIPLFYKLASSDPDTIINLHRNFSFNDQDVLSKESEEALLYRDMQNDAVAQLMRQLEKTPDLSHE